jgi:hypothetical protein
MTTPSEEYDAALGEFRVASRAFREITTKYRTGEMKDAEFLAGKRAFNIAQDAFDIAETKFINSQNNE